MAGAPSQGPHHQDLGEKPAGPAHSPRVVPTRPKELEQEAVRHAKETPLFLTPVPQHHPVQPSRGEEEPTGKHCSCQGKQQNPEGGCPYPQMLFTASNPLSRQLTQPTGTAAGVGVGGKRCPGPPAPPLAGLPSFLLAGSCPTGRAKQPLQVRPGGGETLWPRWGLEALPEAIATCSLPGTKPPPCCTGQ